MAEDTNKNNTPWDRKNELQYHDVSTYLRAWYKRKKTIPPYNSVSDLGFLPDSAHSLLLACDVSPAHGGLQGTGVKVQALNAIIANEAAVDVKQRLLH
jgi:hypothetical protein